MLCYRNMLISKSLMLEERPPGPASSKIEPAGLVTQSGFAPTAATDSAFSDQELHLCDLV